MAEMGAEERWSAGSPQFSLPEEKSQDPAASHKGGRDRRQHGVLRKLSIFAIY